VAAGALRFFDRETGVRVGAEGAAAPS
jgi:hypothetical protein